MSDKSLDQLIDTLKSEGIAAAEKESSKILEKAKQEAKEIVKSAEEKRESILANARQEAEGILSKGEAAFRQAGRDYTIAVRNELLELFRAVLEKETQKEFTPDLLKSGIVKVIENIGGGVELQLSPEYFQELSEYIHARLQSSDVVITKAENNSILNGFSITQKEQGWTYEITPEEVASSLQNYLNHNWVKTLQKEA